MKKIDVVGKRALQSGIAEIEKLVARQRYAEVVETAHRYLRTLPGDGFLRKALAFGLIGLGRYEEALSVIEPAILQSRHDPELHNNLGICYSQVCRWPEAIAAFDRALSMAPKDPELWKNKGAAYHHMYQWPQAIECLVKAIDLFDGDYVDAVELLASALLNNKQSREALTCYDELFKVQQTNLAIVSAHLRTCFVECQWERTDLLLEHIRRESQMWTRVAAPPIFAASFPGLSIAEFTAITQAFAPTQIPGSFLTRNPMCQAHGVHKSPGDRVRIGYLSSDFRNHPVGHVVSSVIELHDRARFDVCGYSMGPGDDSDVRRRLIRAFDHFVDLGGFGVEAIAERISADEIDILIDLQGWTTGARPEVLAMRPARFQGGWIGYPGSLGIARAADFLIADAITVPLEHECYYTERILRLPHCFLPLDARTLPAEPMSRAALGLPEDGFVFCSLNRSDKINSGLFDVWCRLLLSAPGSVLWLARPGGAAGENLIREAALRGVSADRLVFANRVASREQYLGNLGVADLALDTSPYNSHSTGMDTLWAGVPMVSLLGETFAARVGASLLTAAGLDWCIAHSWDEYFDKALSLYHDTERRQNFRQNLVAGRSSLPLFAMPVFVKDLERMLLDLLATTTDKKEDLVH